MAKENCGPLEKFLKSHYAEAKTNQAKRIAEAISQHIPGPPFDVEDVLYIALSNGLDDMERRYCNMEPKTA